MEPDDDPCKTPPACSSPKSSPSSSSIHPEKEPSLKSSSTEDLPSGGESPQKSKEKTRSFIRKVDDKVSKWQQKLVCNLEHKLDRVKSMQTGSKFKSRRLTMNPSHHRRVRGSSDGDAMTSYSAVRTESQSSSSDTSVSVVPTPSLRLKEPSQEPPGEPSSSPADGETKTNETEQPIPEPPPRGQKMFSGLPRHMRSQRSGSITLAMLRSSQPSLRSNSFKRRRRLTSEKLSEDRSFDDDDDDDEAADTVSLLLADEHDSNVDNGSEPEAVINSPVIKSSLFDTALSKWSSMKRLDNVEASRSGSEISLAESFKHRVNQYLQRGLKGVDTVRKLKSQIWTSVVTVVIVEANDLTPRDQDGILDPYCRFRMGNEKYRTKSMPKTTAPKWLEQFDLHLYDDQSQLLEVTVWDNDPRKDEILGRCTINLSELDRETTHRIKKNLEEGSGSVLLLLTITGTTNSETISDLAAYQQQQVENEREEEYRSRRYSILRTWHNVKDVGHLTVKVFKAQGLAAADLGGKSDPFCVLELVNARLQTQTEYKTLSPNWHKIFTFNVKDIHSVLEVTVYDEDRDNKVDFLGKVSIPLLRIQNGEKKWYALKDKKLRRRAKGTNPQILLEMTIIFNPIRASIRTFDPAEEKYMATEPKFKREIFVRNVMRLKNMVMTFVNMSKTVSSWLEWESPPRSIAAFGCFMVATYTFELYMVPIVFLAFFAKNYLMICMANDRGIGTQWDEIDDAEEEDEFVGMAEEADEEKKTWKEKLQAIQEVTQTVQNVMGNIASLWERTLHVFNFTIPFLSWLAIFLLCLVALVLYVVPLRAMIFIWGVLKFTKKLVRPHALNNNEILDFIWRLPDGEQLVEYRELKLIPRVDSDKRKDNKKSHRKPNT